MLAKLTSKNQITIPKDILSKIPKVDYFKVELNDGNILLKPVKVLETNLGDIRKKMEDLGISEDFVAEAVQWARSK
ncbi:MAG: AbrB/MazE/SpoVT family DNA-binding domain-containing protein [Proteobacteria bacterium]|nr:AbrB/MazE/SpoVT family DNA-binding domain-containing protein [Desulfobacteraceae bacterium]MBU4055404.1 AbrB/MazE/SpoVT family DNA-binding domain-containing protein [Pseudomonadota bacterium]MBU4318094.1 AbrB/MazE/SpoVT family DNA-binding domain-containing protein [Pseudomonadota bacterium]MBU4470003.1 AbrB/MazE/SpoVT family DNA-binding domain-containing protein [Pseudomonadota bacterium]MCG2753784.1 AbrB/MazE/SpoVT family DNA-binding domain-containing protein [Desulfobacteraceae bacterium]